ncbi:MAG: 2OG-Fe(II) oxygenase [Pseudomonadota bacterium]
MIQLQKSGEIINPDEVLRLKSEYQAHSCVRLPGLLGADLLKYLLTRLEQQPWIRRDHGGIGADEVLDDESARRLLHFVANAPGFLEAIRVIGCCPEISEFRGEVYRLAPNSDHYDTWHSDAAQTRKQRLIGMSINLGSRAYSGGVFQLRDEETARTIFEVANTGYGDAILFRLSNRLKHRVTPVTGSEPRMAFAGWFRTGATNFYASLRSAVQDA